MRNFKKMLKNRYFITSFSISLITIFFLYFIVYVDFIGRKTLFGVNSPVLSLVTGESSTKLLVNTFGMEKSFDISLLYSIFKAICDFICIPI